MFLIGFASMVQVLIAVELPTALLQDHTLIQAIQYGLNDAFAMLCQEIPPSLQKNVE
jgi:hypothetical protein